MKIEAAFGRRQIGAETYASRVVQFGSYELRSLSKLGMRSFHPRDTNGRSGVEHVFDIYWMNPRLPILWKNGPDVLDLIEVDWEIALAKKPIEFVRGTREFERPALKISVDEIVHTQRMEDSLQRTCYVLGAPRAGARRSGHRPFGALCAVLRVV